MNDRQRRAFFAKRYDGNYDSIPNMGVLTGDDILELRRKNEFIRGNEYGNVFSREEVKRARDERRERPKHIENLHFPELEIKKAKL